jgi:hypothetical protein
MASLIASYRTVEDYALASVDASFFIAPIVAL